MIILSTKRRAEELQKIKAELLKASAAVEQGMDMATLNNAEWARLVENKSQSSESDVPDKPYKAVAVNEEELRIRQKLAGFSAIVFDDKIAASLPREELFTAYTRQLQIEACFRTLKSILSLRPIRNSTEQSIRAHCFVCICSLICQRFILYKAHEIGFKLTDRTLKDLLQKANVSVIGSSKGLEILPPSPIPSQFHSSPYDASLDGLLVALGMGALDRRRKVYSPSDFARDLKISPTGFCQSIRRSFDLLCSFSMANESIGL